eukprot:m.20790 g.20790  ORF g.20790 m.20790 type:complete len:171 (-) comp11053_c0_seq4:587-1099(-)
MSGREEGTKVWVGNLPDDAEKEELERAFSEHGRLNNVWVARRPPGFAFVFFEDARDAQDAVDKMDNSDLFGRQIKVQISHGRRGGGDRGGDRRDFDRRGGGKSLLSTAVACVVLVVVVRPLTGLIPDASEHIAHPLPSSSHPSTIRPPSLPLSLIPSHRLHIASLAHRIV